MHDTPSVRVGIVRPANASQSPVVAEIEARVVRAELERRVGPVVLDLRVDGAAVGPWQPLAHAAWPGGIDVELDAEALWSAAPLTALAGRTIDPVAADVRARMLTHLGVIPTDAYELDAERLAALSSVHIRPTDVWLVAQGAAGVGTGDPAIDALATPSADAQIAMLDAAFDAAAQAVPVSDASVASLVAELTALRARVHELDGQVRRATVEATERLDQLTQERAVLSERLERAELDRTGVA